MGADRGILVKNDAFVDSDGVARVLKAVILGKDPGDISTIEDEGSVEEAREAWEQMRASVTTGS